MFPLVKTLAFFAMGQIQPSASLHVVAPPRGKHKEKLPQASRYGLSKLSKLVVIALTTFGPGRLLGVPVGLPTLAAAADTSCENKDLTRNPGGDKSIFYSAEDYAYASETAQNAILDRYQNYYFGKSKKGAVESDGPARLLNDSLGCVAELLILQYNRQEGVASIEIHSGAWSTARAELVQMLNETTKKHTMRKLDSVPKRIENFSEAFADVLGRVMYLYTLQGFSEMGGRSKLDRLRRAMCTNFLASNP